MKAVFADAFYFVARLNRRDQHHDRVVKFSSEFRASLLTSDWVLMEVADAMAKSESRARFGGFGTEQNPMDLNSIADIASLSSLLSARGWKQDDIEGVMQGNFLRFLREHLPPS